MGFIYKTKDNIATAFGFIKRHAELVVFFFFFTTSLFLGDGKQPFVDVWWALGILTMYGVRYYQRGKLDLYPLPRPIGIAWAALILYYIILTPFSDSAGYSITTTIRLIEAYLVYVMFVTISSEPFGKHRVNIIELFTKGLLFVGVVAILASFVFVLFPSWASFLPPMNLLYAAYGHNHLADLLLFVIPVAVGIAERKKSALNIGLLLFFLVGMALTLARGAWIILIGYLLFLFLRKKDTRVKVIALVGAVALAVAILLLSVGSVNKTTGGTFQNVPQIFRLLQKPSLLEDGRWEYWRQAVEAIKESPLFGSGPGTFYLESKRLQARPSSYSWFAHSFPLEVLVEVGLFGAALWLLFAAYTARTIWAAYRDNENPLIWSVFITTVYSFFEFNLNYAVMWIVFWATLGALLQRNDRGVIYKNNRTVCVGGLIVIVAFYISSISSLVVLGTINNKEAALYLAPFRADTLIQYFLNNTIYKEPPSSTSVYLMRVFHKNDSSAREGVAGYYYSVGLYKNANTSFQEALRYDGNNIETHRRYLESIKKNKDAKALKKEIRLLSRTFLSRDYLAKMNEDDTFIPDVWIQPPEELFSTNSTVDHVRLFLAKIYYLYGLALLEKDPNHTEGLWILARDLNPTLSYYHIELASLETNTFHDSVKSQEFLAYCQQHVQARKYCTDFINNNFSYALSDYPPGYFAKDIRDFPLL